ncbi:MAG: endolytic transglycosylase MltG, partial [Bacteroidales bacterium]|nr:endolytic transglycosylase MltG [Bacteroidales bacterium]
MKKVIIALLLILLVAGAFVAYKAYNYAYAPNVTAENNTYIYIPTGTDYNGLLEILKSSGNVTDMDSFEKVADFKKLDQKVLPGKYKLENGMSNNELVNMLRSGRQTPVKVTFISLRTLDILAGKAAVNIEADSADIATLLKDEETAKKYGFNKQTFCSMFIPNTYEFWWNTSAEEFVQRMADEYKTFWNDDRKA